ncbi:hypothetical protein BDV96DRAFT_574076 [Lophiotrema nucula]|uniref:Uncharacterized protein n=1 Tax=Lophiotrema nucula TaxID=690887 RepID=A0A6A5ZAD5_9PLEO|nr:hypothetical protein BDV96DRAFT_574076 [Lophiotrema nucula]
MGKVWLGDRRTNIRAYLLTCIVETLGCGLDQTGLGWIVYLWCVGIGFKGISWLVAMSLVARGSNFIL